MSINTNKLYYTMFHGIEWLETNSQITNLLVCNVTNLDRTQEICVTYNVIQRHYSSTYYVWMLFLECIHIIVPLSLHASHD